MNVFLIFLMILFCCVDTGYSLSREQTEAQYEISKEEKSLMDMGEIIVSSTRSKNWKRNEYSYTGNVSVIEAEEIENSTGENITQAISKVEAVSVMDNSGFGVGGGIGSIVNVRGVGGGDKVSTNVMLNGVKMNQLVDNSVFWKAIPVSTVEKVEVLKGGTAGVNYGDGALAGVINIETKKPTKESQVEIGTTYGSYGQNTNSVLVSGTKDKLGYVAGLTREFIQGYREQSNYQGTSGSLRLNLDLEDTVYDLYFLSHNSSNEAPGGLTQAQVDKNRKQRGSINGKYWNEYNQVSLACDKKFTDSFDMNIMGYKSWRTNNSDFGWGYFEITEPSIGSSLSLKWDKDLGENRNVFVVGSDVRKQVASTGTKDTVHSHSEVNGYGVYTQNSFYLDEKWTFEGGYRFDEAVYDESLTWPAFDGKLTFRGHSPSVGVRRMINDRYSIFTNVSQTFKMPAIFDIDAVTPDWNDNANIKPQRATNYEAGLDFLPFEKVKGKVSYFIINIKDEILYDSLNYKNSNFDTSRDGLEYKVDYDITEKSTIGCSGTYMNAKFNDGVYDGNRIPLVPRNTYDLNWKYKIDKFWTLGLDWYFVCNQYRGNDFKNNLKAEDYDVLNAGINYKKNNFSSFLNFNNVLNEEYSTYQFSDGSYIGAGEYPMPGFNVLGGVKYVF